MQQVQSVSVDWHTSTFCAAENCVEVAVIGDSIAVRDSKNPAGAVQMYSRDEWSAFVEGITIGDFDFSA
ncbi:DUF397 domain-containing protein [Actinoplanes sp. L3-i22]|uniref:DUF397 domain-containing protein n=1 Tax=Actinoplanes sp. L3-i22 TaxID=2836373 RepID=UPI001C7859F7|nr:DUF397 domain-containing protein [Actinoplanes sp. L3-i22]BCY09269.1 hypothetical protein L3i22_043570 [Actinoplanes sp. L3-i22]